MFDSVGPGATQDSAFLTSSQMLLLLRDHTWYIAGEVAGLGKQKEPGSSPGHLLAPCLIPSLSKYFLQFLLCAQLNSWNNTENVPALLGFVLW